MSVVPLTISAATQHAQSQKATSSFRLRRRTRQGFGPPILPSFVTKCIDPRRGESLQDYWAVSETGDWERDVEIGNAYARDTIRFLREERIPHILNWIAADIIHKCHFGPIEVGFFHEIGTLIVRTRR